MLDPCCEAVGVHVTLMYDSRLLRLVRADLIRPGEATVKMPVILQGYIKALGSTLQKISHDLCAIYITYVKDCLCVGSLNYFCLLVSN